MAGLYIHKNGDFEIEPLGVFKPKEDITAQQVGVICSKLLSFLVAAPNPQAGPKVLEQIQNYVKDNKLEKHFEQSSNILVPQ